MEINTRNNSLDSLKLICSFLVVCIHMEFSWANGYFAAVAQVSVPIFFIITGFFYERTVSRGREIKQIQKIMKLMVASNLFYFLWYLFIYGISGKVDEYLAKTVTLGTVLDFILFNESPFAIHLWYLGALLYGLIVLRAITKRNTLDRAFFLIPVLLACDVLLGKYCIFLGGRDVRYVYSRNWLFVALPCLLLGVYLQKHQECIVERLAPKKGWMVCLSIMWIAVIIAVRRILICYGVNTDRDHYFATFLFAATLFLLALTCNCSEKMKFIARMGRRNATFIYIMHMFVKDFVAFFIPASMTDLYYLVRPIVVFMVSLGLSEIFHYVISMLSRVIKLESPLNT